MISSKTKDILILGFGIFGFLFGAGNLIFPPVLGYQSGMHWKSSLLGFTITDVFLSAICIISFNKYKNFTNFTKPMGSVFTNLYIYSMVVFVILLFVVPRTAATTYEIAIKDYFPWMSSWVFYILYFAVVACFAINPSKVFEHIGKLFSPIFFIFLIFVIFKGVFSIHPHYIHPPILNHPFSNGLTKGFQTVDALAASLQASLSIMVLTSKNYNFSEQNKIILKACSIVVILLCLTYLGLTYLGAAIGAQISPHHEIDTLVYIVHASVGSVGNIILAIAILFACITTAIGDMVLGPFLITDLMKSKNKSKNYQNLYRLLILFFSILGVFVAKNGVDTILTLVSPFLDIVYPILIMFTFLNILNMRHPFVMRPTIYITLIICVISVLPYFHINGLKNFIKHFPLYEEGFIWIVPSCIVAIVMQIFCWKKSHEF